ncbi:MAG: glycosyltransferase [Spirochaetales bacterium]|nr:glycosyltransferase [Spirochaetales bacterium]
MRIAIVSDVIYEYISGLAVFTKRLIEELKNHVEKVIVLTSGRKQSYIERGNVKIYYLKGLRLKKFDFSVGIHPLLSIKKIFREEKTDIVHCMCPLPMGVASVLHAKKINIPVIFTSHIQAENIMNNYSIKFPGLRTILALYGIWLYNSCDYVTCPSLYAKKELIYYGIKNTGRLSIISNGINAERFKPVAYESRKMILFVGRIMPEKCIDILIRASAIVNKYYPDYQFVIAGCGYELEDMKILASQVNPRVIFTGRITEKQLLELFQTCEIFVLPSESELQGICLLEAMACEKPTIASDSTRSAARELANILFKHRNYHDLALKIIYLIENKDIARKIAKKNRELIVREHDYSRIISKYIDLYKQAIKMKNQGNNNK